jgi:hypothetical protein
LRRSSAILRAIQANFSALSDCMAEGEGFELSLPFVRAHKCARLPSITQHCASTGPIEKGVVGFVNQRPATRIRYLSDGQPTHMTQLRTKTMHQRRVLYTSFWNQLAAIRSMPTCFVRQLKRSIYSPPDENKACASRSRESLVKPTATITRSRYIYNHLRILRLTMKTEAVTVFSLA